MPYVTISVNYDRFSGTVAIWLRENAIPLSVLLILASMFVRTLGYFAYLDATCAYILNMSLSVATLGGVLIGFEVIAFAQLEAADGDKSEIAGTVTSEEEDDSA